MEGNILQTIPQNKSLCQALLQGSQEGLWVQRLTYSCIYLFPPTLICKFVNEWLNYLVPVLRGHNTSLFQLLQRNTGYWLLCNLSDKMHKILINSYLRNNIPSQKPAATGFRTDGTWTPTCRSRWRRRPRTTSRSRRSSTSSTARWDLRFRWGRDLIQLGETN